ncbi:MAG: hypothetical protein OHK0039_32130 [Bacteroidia bacterium]
MLALLLTARFQPLAAQVEKVYGENEELLEVNPINTQGEIEGLGVRFYPSGALLREAAYKDGLLHGEVKEYYEDGSLRASYTYVEGRREGLYSSFYPSGRVELLQDWLRGRRHGEMYRYFAGGRLAVFAIMDHDSILFAQRFDDAGHLIYEKIGAFRHEIDTVNLAAPDVFFEQSPALRAGRPGRVQVVMPRVPSTFISYAVRGGSYRYLEGQPYPLEITPDPEAAEVVLYLRIKVLPAAQPSILRSVRLPVAPTDDQ